MKILIIEDDSEIVGILNQTMKLKWPEVTIISTAFGKEGIDIVKEESPDIIILDLGLPDIDGIQVLHNIRSFSNTLVAILTARGEEEDRIKGLEAGADEYMVKPFSPVVLVAQLQAMLRRVHTSEPTTTISNDPAIQQGLFIDTENQAVTRNGDVIKMGPREYDLLNYMFTNKGKVISNQELLENIFPGQDADIRFLRVYMNKLLDKLGDDAYNPKIITNEENLGYKFVGL